MILNEISVINENTVLFDATKVIRSATLKVQLKDSGATQSQKGIANIIERFASMLLKEDITDDDVANMKSYIDSVNENYFSKK